MSFLGKPEHNKRVEKHGQWCSPLDRAASSALWLLEPEMLLAVTALPNCKGLGSWKKRRGSSSSWWPTCASATRRCSRTCSHKNSSIIRRSPRFGEATAGGDGSAKRHTCGGLGSRTRSSSTGSIATTAWGFVGESTVGERAFRFAKPVQRLSIDVLPIY